MPCARELQRASEDICGFLAGQVFDEREVKERQAISSLECDSAGAEPTIAMLFVAMNLPSTQGAPKGCICEAWVRSEKLRVKGEGGT